MKKPLERVILVNLAVTLVLFAALEASFRACSEPRSIPTAAPRTPRFSPHEAAPYVVFHSTPGVDLRVRSEQQRRPGRRTHIVTDRYGFRYAGDLDQPKRDGELRLFMLGGSVVFRGLSNATTICGVLERRLSEHLGAVRRVRCINAGIVSAVSDQELGLLLHTVADLEPDLVVAFDGFNDFWCRATLEPRIGYPCNWLLIESAYDRTRARSDLAIATLEGLPAWKLLLARSRLALHFAPGLALEHQMTRRLVDQTAAPQARPPAGDVAAHLLRNWRKMNLVTNALGAEFVAILQPVAPDTRNKTAYAEFYDRMNREIEAAARGGQPFYSFDRLLDERPEYFYDEVHTWDEAHEEYAARMLALLAERGLLERWKR